MRKRALFVVTSIAACGCAADPSWRQAAVDRCQTVGISEKDPQFDTCTRVLIQSDREQRIENAYHKASEVLYDPNKRHDEVTIY